MQTHVAQTLPKRWRKSFQNTHGASGRAGAGSITSRMMTILTSQPSTYSPMFNLNRRHTEALEKSARAKKRLADAEESIARNLGAFLSDSDVESETPPPLPKKDVPPKKDQPRER